MADDKGVGEYEFFFFLVREFDMYELAGPESDVCGRQSTITSVPARRISEPMTDFHVSVYPRNTADRIAKIHHMLLTLAVITDYNERLFAQHHSAVDIVIDEQLL